MHCTTNDTLLGSFRNSEYNTYFEYTLNDFMPVVARATRGEMVEFEHRVFVGDNSDGRGWRFAHVMGTVVYIITDEDENGFVVEKWAIKNHRKYEIY